MMFKSNPYEELLTKVEALKNIMTECATGGVCDEASYKKLRNELLNNPILAEKLPYFVRTCRSISEFWEFIKEKSPTYAGRRRFMAEAFDEVLTFLELAISSPADTVVDERLLKVGSSYVYDVWKRALDRRATDPEGAITLARTLLEAVCKYILNAMDIEYEDKADLPHLYHLVATHLNLSPSKHIEPVFKRILGGCSAVVEGLGALRNRLGDAHARGKKVVKPAPRHAELAVNLAGTMATFLIATWEAKGSTKNGEEKN